MKWVLVTGAGKRLGRACALDLAQHGWSVAAHYRTSRDEAEAVAAAAREAGVEAVAVGGDISDPAQAARVVEQAREAAGGKLVGLVNSAAIFEHDVLESATPEALDKHMHINALAPALMARAFADGLEQSQRGAVVNFLDFKLASPYPDHFSYTLSKYAAAGAVDVLARALAPMVRVTAVAPGYIMAAPGQSAADHQRLHADTPLEYGPTPEDIAGAVRFLIENPAVTGQTIYVDAGRRFVSYDRDMAFM
jgi:NAD(P)-dependent dehydrogenase (short-subunit alcohol dehydrogenase family)